MPIIGYKLGMAYGWSNDRLNGMNYIQFQQLSDAVVSENFEGLPNRLNTTEFEWGLIRNSQKVAAIKSFDKYGLKLFQSRQFETPGMLMIRRVYDIYYYGDKNDTIKLYIESAHDTHLLSTLFWLDPLDYDYEYMPFSSSICFEVHYNTTCLEIEKNIACFTVEVYHNGKPLKFDSCLKANLARGSTSPIC